MKKWLKNIFLVIVIIVLGLIIDLIWIFSFNRPLFAIKVDNGDSVNIVYKGLFYNTYNCIEYSVPQILSKFSKFSCSIGRADISNSIDNNEIVKDDIIGEDGLLFSIAWKKLNCVPVQLSIYDNGEYELYTSYEGCNSNEGCNLMLVYTEKKSGIYNYDVMKIINNSIIADNMTFTNENRPEYEIYTGNGEKVYMLITDSNNKYLDEFLKQIDVNLKTCAKPDYK